MEALLLSQATTAAAAATQVIDWEKVLLQYGPLYALFLLFIFFVVWYGPGLLEGHRKMMEAVGNASTRTAEATETLTESLGQAVTEISATRKNSEIVKSDLHDIKAALGHGISASEKILKEQGRKHDSDVIIELGKARNQLDPRGKPQ
jgi:hypothetical protein